MPIYYIHLLNETPFSSGFGKATVGKVGSGWICEVTSWTGGKWKVVIIWRMKGAPTPCIAVYIIGGQDYK